MHIDDFDKTSRREQLHFAAQEGNLERVQQLLSEGHDINAFDDLGMTALHYAAKFEWFAVAECLIERGADVNARYEPGIGNTPLGEVAQGCSLRIAQLLLDAGADPTIPGWMQLSALDKAKNRKRGDGPNVYDLLLRASRRRAGRPTREKR